MFSRKEHSVRLRDAQKLSPGATSYSVAEQFASSNAIFPASKEHAWPVPVATEHCETGVEMLLLLLLLDIWAAESKLRTE